eukprot:CAMPEP_0172445956 /NCGR_PEP_ID=MMETSP1065-20121228/5692_1 /TAXON_ID=265537 /ORGANISM="Amphiprora paludosa, Strain CCMP125" /LENGTH=956 /DNA_ID=CAMNT_0013196971 /DNA_START=158 /DNA_END=3029 /DNA_ORIENTATION=+
MHSLVDELSNLPPDQNIDPCILYDEGPEPNDSNSTSYDLVVQNIQITPHDCRDHRDGAPMAIKKLNEDNGGQGFPIGFNKDFFLGFRLFSVVAGNSNFLGQEAYLEIHTQILNSFLEDTDGQMRYIIGSCSFTSSAEKEPAGDHEAILMAQVGPPGFYEPRTSNPWVFGIHVSSDDYPLAAARKLSFQATQNDDLATQPVRVIYRTSSEFFFSTCASALKEIRSAGFQDVAEVLYDPDADEDGDGTPNHQDFDFLESIADTICPPGSAENPDFRPAIFMCTLREQDIILPRFRENGCLPSSMWLTSATWGFWTEPNLDAIEDFQGAGQWHPKFTYNDQFFDSGLEMIEANEAEVGYYGGYDMLVSYAVPILFAQHLQQAYRVFDNPTPDEDILTPSGREVLRRRMLDLRADTLFGPVQFNDNQRNIGRGSAAVQWQPDSDSEGEVKSALVSPDNQAEAEIIIPAATADDCQAGEFHNVSVLLERTSLLQSVCQSCPEDSYTTAAGQRLECEVCPSGTSTDGFVGATNCTYYDDNLLSNGMLSFGYVAMSVSWLMAVVFLGWIFKHREDPVVRLAQIPYLVLICVGGIISTSSIIGVTMQAGTGEDTSAADAGCKSVPILYSIGWIIQYGSVCAKTLRLKRVVENSSGGRRTAITAWRTGHAIAIPLIVDIAILIAWSVIDPLQYEREEEGRSVQDGVLTIESIGRCRPAEGDISVWAFLGPLFANHIILILWTHWLLWQVRNVSNRYQENKYLGMAAIFALEVAVVGVPILIAAQDSVEATFFVISGIVALDNIGVLCFIFIPKIFFQMKGLEEGVTVGESVLKDTHRQSVLRESGRRLSSLAIGSSMSNVSAGVLPSIAEASESEDLHPEDKSSGSLQPIVEENQPMLSADEPLYKDSSTSHSVHSEHGTADSTDPETQESGGSSRARGDPEDDEEHPRDEPEEQAKPDGSFVVA